jgi:hypothetical protein
MTSTIKVNTIQNTCGADIIKESSNTITIGASGDTVTLASGASQTGFGRTGTVDWQTGSIKTSTFTAANGEGYFADTSSGAFVMNLPAGTAGNIVSVVDYTNTFQTNALTVTPNGSQKIGGVAASATLSTEGQSVTFVYVDDTEGWKNVQDSSSNVTGISFISATGGTITTCGNDKIHTFTGPGTFCVSGLATDSANDQVSYMVVAGGGGGGCSDYTTGGGGAGGFREDKSPTTPYTASPLDGAGDITVTVTAFPITVGGGGAVETNGNPSTFSTKTSAGGGFGGKNSPSNGGPGGSGGGGRAVMAPTSVTSPGGTGNTPPVSPAQGQNGGTGTTAGRINGGGGGGGAGAAGNIGSAPTAGPGGNGVPSGINPSTCVGVPGPAPGRWYAGGGGGGSNAGADGGTNTTGGCGGEGGGGRGAARGPGYPTSRTSTAGTTNTGSGGGAAGGDSNGGSAGGSGIVIIRYKAQ